MPFAKTTESHTESYWTDHYKNFLKPIIEETLEITVTRSSPMRSDILKGIIKDLIHSDIVVADLTDNNPNVFWELGVQQSFKHGTVTIAEEGTKLPFDISSKGTLFYSNKNHIKTKSFIKSLKLAVKDCTNNPERPDSNVLETLTGRGTIQEITARKEIKRKLDALVIEYESNYSKFNDIIRVMRENTRKKKPGQSVRTERLRTSSIELLMTNRYLETKYSLYQYAETYFDSLNTLNGQLMIWESHAKGTEDWCLKQVKGWRKEYRDFLRNLKNEIKRFEQRM